MSDFLQYRITALTGRVYTLTMVLNRAMSRPLRKHTGVTRAEIRAVLEDHVWMRGRTDQVPSAVAREAIFEAFHRKTAA